MGPGHTEAVVAPAFARKSARIEAAMMETKMAVGALDQERDFLDIPDICRAHIASVQNFGRLPKNQVINIASSKMVRIGTVLDISLANSTHSIAMLQDPSRLVAVEIRRALCNDAQVRELLGWLPHFGLEDTVRAVPNFARQQNGAGLGGDR